MTKIEQKDVAHVNGVSFRTTLLHYSSTELTFI